MLITDTISVRFHGSLVSKSTYRSGHGGTATCLVTWFCYQLMANQVTRQLHLCDLTHITCNKIHSFIVNMFDYSRIVLLHLNTQILVISSIESWVPCPLMTGLWSNNSPIIEYLHMSWLFGIWPQDWDFLFAIVLMHGKNKPSRTHVYPLSMVYHRLFFSAKN